MFSIQHGVTKTSIQASDQHLEPVDFSELERLLREGEALDEETLQASKEKETTIQVRNAILSESSAENINKHMDEIIALAQLISHASDAQIPPSKDNLLGRLDLLVDSRKQTQVTRVIPNFPNNYPKDFVDAYVERIIQSGKSATFDVLPSLASWTFTGITGITFLYLGYKANQPENMEFLSKMLPAPVVTYLVNNQLSIYFSVMSSVMLISEGMFKGRPITRPLLKQLLTFGFQQITVVITGAVAGASGSLAMVIAVKVALDITNFTITKVLGSTIFCDPKEAKREAEIKAAEAILKQREEDEKLLRFLREHRKEGDDLNQVYQSYKDSMKNWNLSPSFFALKKKHIILGTFGLAIVGALWKYDLLGYMSVLGYVVNYKEMLNYAGNNLVKSYVVPKLVELAWSRLAMRMTVAPLLNKIFGRSKVTDVAAIDRMKKALEYVFATEFDWDVRWSVVMGELINRAGGKVTFELSNFYIPKDLYTKLTSANYTTFYNRSTVIIQAIYSQNRYSDLFDMEFLSQNLSPLLEEIKVGDIIYNEMHQPIAKVVGPNALGNIDTGDVIVADMKEYFWSDLETNSGKPRYFIRSLDRGTVIDEYLPINQDLFSLQQVVAGDTALESKLQYLNFPKDKINKLASDYRKGEREVREFRERGEKIVEEQQEKKRTSEENLEYGENTINALSTTTGLEGRYQMFVKLYTSSQTEEIKTMHEQYVKAREIWKKEQSEFENESYYQKYWAGSKHATPLKEAEERMIQMDRELYEAHRHLLYEDLIPKHNKDVEELNKLIQLYEKDLENMQLHLKEYAKEIHDRLHDWTEKQGKAILTGTSGTAAFQGPAMKQNESLFEKELSHLSRGGSEGGSLFGADYTGTTRTAEQTAQRLETNKAAVEGVKQNLATKEQNLVERMTAQFMEMHSYATLVGESTTVKLLEKLANMFASGLEPSTQDLDELGNFMNKVDTHNNKVLDQMKELFKEDYASCMSVKITVLIRNGQVVTDPQGMEHCLMSSLSAYVWDAIVTGAPWIMKTVIWLVCTLMPPLCPLLTPLNYLAYGWYPLMVTLSQRIMTLYIETRNRIDRSDETLTVQDVSIFYMLELAMQMMCGGSKLPLGKLNPTEMMTKPLHCPEDLESFSYILPSDIFQITQSLTKIMAEQRDEFGEEQSKPVEEKRTQAEAEPETQEEKEKRIEQQKNKKAILMKLLGGNWGEITFTEWTTIVFPMLKKMSKEVSVTLFFGSKGASGVRNTWDRLEKHMKDNKLDLVETLTEVGKRIIPDGLSPW